VNAPPPGLPLVIDTSAWTRRSQPPATAFLDEVNELDLLVACPVVALELFRTARTETEFESLDRSFSALPQAPVTDTVCRAALTASRELGARRRIPVPDYLIAAAAAERGFGVLHADKHFDLLAEALEFESVWLPE
jgi:predicted nucleic acid-binding protein